MEEQNQDIKDIEELVRICDDHYYSEGKNVGTYEDNAVAIGWMQNLLMAKVALQLVKQNELLDRLNHNVGFLAAGGE